MGAPRGPDQPAEIPPPQSLQVGHVSNISSKMLEVHQLKKNLPQPCLQKAPSVLVPRSREESCVSSTACSSLHLPAHGSQLVSSPPGSIWRVCHWLEESPSAQVFFKRAAALRVEEGKMCTFQIVVLGSVCDRCSHTDFQTHSVHKESSALTAKQGIQLCSPTQLTKYAILQRAILRSCLSLTKSTMF